MALEVPQGHDVASTQQAGTSERRWRAPLVDTAVPPPPRSGPMPAIGSTSAAKTARGALVFDISEGDIETEEPLEEWPFVQDMESASGADSGGCVGYTAAEMSDEGLEVEWLSQQGLEVSAPAEKARDFLRPAPVAAGEIPSGSWWDFSRNSAPPHKVAEPKVVDEADADAEADDEDVTAARAAASRLSHQDAEKRCLACLDLAVLGRAARPFFWQVLRSFREDQNAEVRMAAAEAVVALGENHAEEAASALKEQLGSADPALRRVTVLCLGHLHGAHTLAPDVALLLQDRDLQVRDAALVSLCLMIEGGAEPTPEIARAVATRLREPLLRDSAATVLGMLGREGAYWAEELLPYLSDSDSRTREAVAEALLGFRDHLEDDVLEELHERSSRLARFGPEALGAEAARLVLARLKTKLVIVD